MSAPEFSRPVDVRQAEGLVQNLVASEPERKALAQRFALVSIDSLTADLALSRKDRTVSAEGRLHAAIVQSCAVSGEDLPVTIDEPLAFRFVPEASHEPGDEEVELDAEDCDEIDYSGSHIDLGEAVAQSLALAIDPYAEGPQAEEARRKAGLLDEGGSGPFAALAALKKRD